MSHILLLEPDRPLARIYSQALEQAGHSVATCVCAQEAVFAADDHVPALVLVELQLIGHSGIEFLYEFRSYVEWQAIPVVIVSQVPPTELQSSSKLLKHQLGVSAYYYKPQFSLRDLLRVTQDSLQPAAV